MVEAGAKLDIPGIKQRLVLINMAAMTLKMLPLYLKMTRQQGLKDIIGNHNHHQHENEPVMKAEQEKTKCLMERAVLWLLFKFK